MVFVNGRPYDSARALESAIPLRSPASGATHSREGMTGIGVHWTHGSQRSLPLPDPLGSTQAAALFCVAGGDAEKGGSFGT